MTTIQKTLVLLAISNLFMMTAWYFHLKTLGDRPWFIAVMASWGIAFFEYIVHIPANRIGFEVLSLAQLQILQISMSLILFIPFAILVMNTPVRMDYIWAAFCLAGASYFIFRSGL